ncbi:MAG TPA: DUF1697 domain-containing protein [Gemmatimonadales bacterium]|jgi:uncharacterized protein (DUF1697 family)|nr:DUF1697 domain-containing protein [Gemmatimonadales bacterium]
MSSRHIALLRGINVGKAKRVAMAELRALFEQLGFRDVRTLLNSGNVVFTVIRPKKNLGPALEKAIAERLGVTSRVTILTAAELDAIVAANPLLKVATNHSRLMVSVVNSAADMERLQPLLKREWGADRIGVGPRVAYLWCPDSILDSEVAIAVAKMLGDGVTSRNWTTISKLHALVKSKATHP